MMFPSPSSQMSVPTYLFAMLVCSWEKAAKACFQEEVEGSLAPLPGTHQPSFLQAVLICVFIGLYIHSFIHPQTINI